MRPNPSSSPRSRGFTLIELLIVTSLLAVVAGAVYSNFSAGARIWKALVRPVPEEGLALFYQRAAEDFRHAVRFSLIPFEGDQEKASFACLIHADEAVGGDRGIGQVRYSYDQSARAIVKSVWNMSELFSERPGRGYALYQGVTRFKISYFVMDKMTKDTEWTDEWSDEETESIPLAVRFEFEADTTEGRQDFVRTFMVPAGGLL